MRHPCPFKVPEIIKKEESNWTDITLARRDGNKGKKRNVWMAGWGSEWKSHLLKGYKGRGGSLKPLIVGSQLEILIKIILG